MLFTEVKGDLFTAPKGYVFAHCISVDCAMGAGIAVEFNRRFKGMKQDLLRRGPKIGDAMFFTDKSSRDSVFNLITKEKYWGKPTHRTLHATLIDMARQVQEMGITKLAMPKIASGLDRLPWGMVREQIQEVFHDFDVDIVIYQI